MDNGTIRYQGIEGPFDSHSGGYAEESCPDMERIRCSQSKKDRVLSYYTHLLKSGVKLYEWRTDSMSHAKTAVIDNIWSRSDLPI
jgi:hypothetical protein